jgi:hypothetical protein
MGGGINPPGIGTHVGELSNQTQLHIVHMDHVRRAPAEGETVVDIDPEYGLESSLA